MFAQSVCIVEFPELYNILKEIKSLFKFNINNYNNSSDFINELNINNLECVESIIIAKKKIDKLVINNKIDKNAILVLEELPIKIQKLVDTINIQLIKKKYNFQSKISIKNYSLNFNSRIVSNKNNELKLTEREIDIILFLSENKSPQSVEILQKKVWGHSFDLETHTVETHIYRLRKKFKDKFSDEDFIISKDVGYSI